MVNGAPWIADLTRATPWRQVEPRVRVRTARRVGGDHGEDLEEVAYQCSGGERTLYMTFVQRLLADGGTRGVDAFEAECRRPDECQASLGDVNVTRNRLLERLSSRKFTCPEVPEAMDSQRACPKCRGTDLMAMGRQTRGADEPETIFYTCLNRKCGAEFR